MSEISAEQGVGGGRRWYHRMGPGLITACVVIGPGSIVTSSQVGATHGYSLLWVIAVSVMVMLTYITLGAKLGVVSQRPTGDLIRERAGRWLALFVGLGAFFISAAYQFGNNLGVHFAVQVFVEDFDWSIPVGSRSLDPFDYVVVLFNGLAIAFLFWFRNLYKALERLMMAFVALLLLSFFINLAMARPNLGALLAGFIPFVDLHLVEATQLSPASGAAPGEGTWLLGFTPNYHRTWDLSLFGLIGTTFVTTAAYFQSYLVRQKGWQRSDLSSGLIDSRIGAVIMALITIMLMATAAAVLRGEALGNVKDIARSLEPLLGAKGQAVFCLGLFSAAYSSFLVNTMIGGFILADGLGLSSDPKSAAPRILTTVALLTGMGVALYMIKKEDASAVGLIVAAQAAVVLVAPLMAGVLWWLTNCRDIMGEDRNGWRLNALAAVGFLILLGIATWLVTEKIWPQVSPYLASLMPGQGG